MTNSGVLAVPAVYVVLLLGSNCCFFVNIVHVFGDSPMYNLVTL